MPNNPTYFALLKACSQAGCPICRLEQQAVERYLDHLFYESVNDGETRAHLRASLGFCREHVGLLLDAGLGDALGMSMIYHDVLGTVLKRLSHINLPLGKATPWSRLLQCLPPEVDASLKQAGKAVSPQETCLACQQRENTARMVLSIFAEKIQEEELLMAFTHSDGLCLPHLSRLCEHVREGVALVKIIQVEVGKLEKLHTELAEFIRKNDYRFLKDGFGPEGNAWRRAASLAAGRGNIAWKPEQDASTANE